MSHTEKLVLVLSTVERKSDAERIAGELVAGSLAACVQIDGPISSVYRWGGNTESSIEYRLVIKTSIDAWPLLKQRLSKIHPYDEPQIVMLHIADATQGYADWVIDQTS